MSLAGDVITLARDLHPTFTRAQTPDAVALRTLTTMRSMLWSAATRAHRAAFIVTTAYPLTAADVTNGLTLDPSAFIENLRQKVYEDTLPLALLESAHEVNGTFTPRYAQVQGQDLTTLRLYPADPVSWQDTTFIYVDRIPALPALTTLAAETGLQPEADLALAAMVATHFAARSGPKSGVDMNMIRELRDRSMADYMAHLSEQRRSASFQITEQWG